MTRACGHLWLRGCSQKADCVYILSFGLKTGCRDCCYAMTNGNESSRCCTARQQSLGRSRGGLSTKIHAVVDGLGNLARFRLTGGERHDITEAANLIDGMENVGAVVADKAFDAASLLDCIEAMNATAVIPPKANRKAIGRQSEAMTNMSIKVAISLSASLLASSSSVVSLRATTNSMSGSKHSSPSSPR